MKNAKNKATEKLRGLLLVACAVLFVSGCAATPEATTRSFQEDLRKEREERENREEREKKQKEREAFLATFDEAEYKPFSKSGTGSVSGQAFAVTQGGEVRYGAGRKVILLPSTEHGIAWLVERARVYNYALRNIGLLPREENLWIMDPRAEAFTETTVADAEGRFTFVDLPPGGYLVGTLISWEVGGRQLGRGNHTGAYFYGVAIIEREGQRVTVKLER